MLRALPVGSKAAADSSPAAPIQRLMNGIDAIRHPLIEPTSFNAFVEFLKRNDAPATAWLKQSATILYDMWRKLDDSYYRPPMRRAHVDQAQGFEFPPVALFHGG